MTRWLPAMLGALALPVTSLAQESVFNLPAFAVPEEGSTIRTRALGGAGSGVGGDVFTLANPAPIARFRRAGLYLSLIGQNVTVDGEDATGDFTDVMFPMAQIVIPGWEGSVFAVGYYQFVDFDTDLEATVEFEGDSLPVELESTGGVSVLSPAAAYSFGAATQVGVSADFYLGSREIVRVVDLQELSPGALAASDSLTRDFGGVGFTIGVERAIGPRVRLSAAYRHRPTIESEVTQAPDDALEGVRSEFDLPSEVILGAAWQPSQGLVATAGYRRSSWSSFDPAGVENVGFGDAIEVGGGIEYSSAVERAMVLGPQAPLRLGYRWRRLPLEIDGEPVREWVASLGYGRTLGATGRSGVDVVLEYGHRGSLDDHGLEESFVRLGVGFRTFEQWRRDRPDN
jgi:long-subunit fatty acid transport protein